jgi:hypothetical protein
MTLPRITFAGEQGTRDTWSDDHAHLKLTGIDDEQQH